MDPLLSLDYAPTIHIYGTGGVSGSFIQMYDTTPSFTDKIIFNLISENNGTNDYSLLTMGNGSSTQNITIDGNVGKIAANTFSGSTASFNYITGGTASFNYITGGTASFNYLNFNSFNGGSGNFDYLSVNTLTAGNIYTNTITGGTASFNYITGGTASFNYITSRGTNTFTNLVGGYIGLGNFPNTIPTVSRISSGPAWFNNKTFNNSSIPPQSIMFSLLILNSWLGKPVSINSSKVQFGIFPNTTPSPTATPFILNGRYFWSFTPTNSNGYVNPNTYVSETTPVNIGNDASGQVTIPTAAWGAANITTIIPPFTTTGLTFPTDISVNKYVSLVLECYYSDAPGYPGEADYINDNLTNTAYVEYKCGSADRITFNVADLDKEMIILDGITGNISSQGNLYITGNAASGNGNIYSSGTIYTNTLTGGTASFNYLTGGTASFNYLTGGTASFNYVSGGTASFGYVTGSTGSFDYLSVINITGKIGTIPLSYNGINTTNFNTPYIIPASTSTITLDYPLYDTYILYPSVDLTITFPVASSTYFGSRFTIIQTNAVNYLISFQTQIGTTTKYQGIWTGYNLNTHGGSSNNYVANNNTTGLWLISTTPNSAYLVRMTFMCLPANDITYDTYGWFQIY